MPDGFPPPPQPPRDALHEPRLDVPREPRLDTPREPQLDAPREPQLDGPRIPAGEATRPSFRATRTLRDPRALVEAGFAAPGALPGLRAVAERYAISVTPAVAAIIDPADPADPIARQYLPDVAELVTAPGELDDPTADHPHAPVAGVVHRYPDRALLKPLLACPVYCRFCFRREQVGPDGGVLTEAQLDAAIDYFAGTPALREAILTGGDPLMLSPRRLAEIIGRLSAIPHIEVIRIHSRIPVADPGRITAALAEALDSDKALFLCVHANHAREFTDAARAGLRRLARAGVALLGQSVLLRGVNDSTEALEALFRAMLAARVKPYYLHQLDRAPGTARFEVPIAEGQAILRALRGRVTGLAWPVYALDLPGGRGKAPLDPGFAAREDGGWRVEAPLGGAPHHHADAVPPAAPENAPGATPGAVRGAARGTVAPSTGSAAAGPCRPTSPAPALLPVPDGDRPADKEGGSARPSPAPREVAEAPPCR